MDIDLFNIKEIWQIGTRVYFGDEFIKIAPIEKEAYDFFFKYSKDPFLGVSFQSFCKRINKIYTQKLEELEKLTKEIEKGEKFENVKLLDRPSSIGLPKTISYIRSDYDLKIEFDGIVFLIEKRISNKTFSLNMADEYVEKKGAILDDPPPYPLDTKIGKDLLMKSSAKTNWRYVTNDAEFNEDLVKVFRNPIFSIRYIDPRVKRVTYPTGDTSIDKEYIFLIGEREHIKQVISHETETVKFLDFIKNGLETIKEDIYEKREDIKGSKLVPLTFKEFFNPYNWINTKNYWRKVHKDLEKTIEYKTHLDIFFEIVKAYKYFIEEGISFYNLENPIKIQGEEIKEMAQYFTPKPFPISINKNIISINEYDKTICSYYGYPEKLIELLSFVNDRANDTLEFIKNITTTSSVYTSVSGTILAWLAIIIAVIALIITVF